MSKMKQPEYLKPRTYSDTNSRSKLARRAAKKLGFDNLSALIRYLLDGAIDQAGIKEREA